MRLAPAPQGTDARPTMSFVPFEQMTDRQQAEHLVYAHGFDVDYFWLPEHEGDALSTLGNNEDVVAAFLAERFGDHNTNGSSYPHPSYRQSWHDGDHEDGDTRHGGADRCLHTHTKEV